MEAGLNDLAPGEARTEYILLGGGITIVVLMRA
jgi:hypothetical protein